MRYAQLLFERNIVNIVEIENFVNEMAGRAQNPNVGKWVRTMLPNFLKKTYPKLQKVQPVDLPKYFPRMAPDWATKSVEQGDLFSVQIDPELREIVAKTIDYMESEAATHNLSRIPFEAALVKSEQWHKQLAAQAPETPNLGPGVGIVFKAYQGGIKWVQMTTPECLDHESNAMGHCVGRGSYDQGLASGHLKIFSLRDAEGDSHVTASIEGASVREIKGKQNKVPVPKYVPFVIDLLNNLPLKGEMQSWNGQYDLNAMGIFQGAKGFGPITSVAKSVTPLRSGNKLAILNAKNYYVITDAAAILLRFVLAGKIVNYINVTDGVPPKSVQNDLKDTMNQFLSKGYTVDDNAANVLVTEFGLVVNGTALESITADMKLVDKDLFHASYVGPKVLVVVDDQNHPLIYMAIIEPTTKPRATDYQAHESYSKRQAGWVDAIPFFLKTVEKLKIRLDRGTIKDLKMNDWFFEDGGWQQGKKMVENLKPVFSNWYEVGDWLWFYFDDKVMGALHIMNKNDEPGPGSHQVAYLIDEVDEDFNGNSDKIAADVVEIFEEGVAEVSKKYYDEDPFLINYDVYCDGNDSFMAINYDQEVTLTYTFYNVNDDEVKEDSHQTTFGLALSDIGEDSDGWLLNVIAGKIFYYDGCYDSEREYSDGDIDNDEDYYADPDGYRKEHGIKKGRKLPAISREVTTICR